MFLERLLRFDQLRLRGVYARRKHLPRLPHDILLL